jgi:hypothetical protein
VTVCVAPSEVSVTLLTDRLMEVGTGGLVDSPPEQAAPSTASDRIRVRFMSILGGKKSMPGGRRSARRPNTVSRARVAQ